MEIRGRLIALKDLLGPDAILKSYRVTLEDIELLAFVEDEIRRIAPPREGGE